MHWPQLLLAWKKSWNFLVLRDNWLAISRKVNLQLGNGSLVAMKTMSHRTMLSKETTKPLNNASTTFFARPCVTKSIQSWTIT
jgi:DNA-directed RNA polymerase-5 subunit 1